MGLWDKFKKASATPTPSTGTPTPTPAPTITVMTEKEAANKRAMEELQVGDAEMMRSMFPKVPK